VGEYTSKGFQEYRYVRLPEMYDLGAVAFKFDIDYENKTIRFSYTVCSGRDNFSREIARRITSERMDNNDVIVNTYESNMSLTENAISSAQKVLTIYRIDENFRKEINDCPDAKKNYKELVRMVNTYESIKETEDMLSIFSEEIEIDVL